MDYFEHLMLEGFDFITTHAFPDSLDEYQRIELLTYFIQYFQNFEEYEKCEILKKRMENVMDDPIKEYNEYKIIK